jgi:hypothetical protein
VLGTREDLGRRVGMVADQAVKEGGVVIGHTCTVDPSADGTLTPADIRSVWPTLGRCSLSVF